MAFVGGINIIDDRNDLNHGATAEPRLDFAVELRGPVVGPVAADGACDVDPRRFGREWRDEVRRAGAQRRAAWRARAR